MPHKTASTGFYGVGSMQRWPTSQTSPTGRVRPPRSNGRDKSNAPSVCAPVGYSPGVQFRWAMRIETTRVDHLPSLAEGGATTCNRLDYPWTRLKKPALAPRKATHHSVCNQPSQSSPPPIGHGSTAGPCIRTRVRCRVDPPPHLQLAFLYFSLQNPNKK